MKLLRTVFLIAILLLLEGLAIAATDLSSFLTSDAVAGQTASAGWQRPEKHSGGLRFGIGFKAGSLGAGGEAALGLSRHFSLRAGANFFAYNRTFNDKGISYPTAMTLRSGQMTIDWFPFGGSFHISPGVAYDDNRVTARPFVATGQNFTLNGTAYKSGSTPVSGWAYGSGKPIAPMLLVGWGNLAHRTKHMIFSVEGGVMYQGTPKISMGLSGNVCDTSGAFCRSILSDATALANVAALQAKLNHNASPYVVYPVFMIGIGYRF